MPLFLLLGNDRNRAVLPSFTKSYKVASVYNWGMLNPFAVLILGLALSLSGVYLFSRHAARLASDEVKTQLRRWSNRTWPALLTGFFSTVIVQSSSLVSSLAVALSGSKLITIRGGILLFLGANVGTTVLDQVIASPLLGLGPWIVLAGAILYLFNWRHSRLAGTVLFTVGLIFWGIALMSGAFAAESGVLSHQYIVQLAQRPWLMFGFGIGLTALIQSSSASTGIALAAVLAGVLPAAQVIPFFLGADIGTTVTENMASLMTKRPGKVVARASFAFSLIVGLVIMGMLGWFTNLIDWLTPDSANPARLAANAHIIVNAAAALLALPFLKQIEGLASRLVPRAR